MIKKVIKVKQLKSQLIIPLKQFNSFSQKVGPWAVPQHPVYTVYCKYSAVFHELLSQFV